MDTALVQMIADIRLFTVAVFVVVAGLFGYAIYGFTTMARIQREIFQELRELRRSR